MRHLHFLSFLGEKRIISFYSVKAEDIIFSPLEQFSRILIPAWIDEMAKRKVTREF